MRRLLPSLVVLGLLASCTPTPPSTHWATVLEITPAFLTDRPVFDPALAAGPDGRIALTYVTRDTAGADLWLALSIDSGATFRAPVRLNTRHGGVASFPESHPVAAFGPAGQLVVAWTAARDSGRFADDIVARASDDAGANFASEIFLNDDHATPLSTYHGFVALAFTPGGRALAAWIDGRAATLTDDEGEPTQAEIWTTASDDGGRTWGPNTRAASRVCPCCCPALRAGGAGVALAYRGVRDSLRDPRLALSRDEGATWAVDTLVADDRWKLPGCPATGPALTAGPAGGWIAWYTGGAGAHGEGPGVYAAPWRAANGGVGLRRALADSVGELSRPVLVSLGAETLFGAQVRTRSGRRAVVVRTLSTSGAASPWLALGANARATTIAALDSRRACVAWIEQSDAGPRLRLARLTRR